LGGKIKGGLWGKVRRNENKVKMFCTNDGSSHIRFFGDPGEKKKRRESNEFNGKHGQHAKPKEEKKRKKKKSKKESKGGRGGRAGAIFLETGTNRGGKKLGKNFAELKKEQKGGGGGGA